jgi:hypothetical protein
VHAPNCTEQSYPWPADNSDNQDDILHKPLGFVLGMALGVVLAAVLALVIVKCCCKKRANADALDADVQGFSMLN